MRFEVQPDLPALLQAVNYLMLSAAVIFMSLACSALSIIATWRVFSKAGEPGWKAVIPFYNEYIMFKLCWSPWFYWAYLACIFAVSIFSCLYSMLDNWVAGLVISLVLAVVVVVFDFIIGIRLSRRFGKGVLFGIGTALVPVVFLSILAFGKAQYIDDYEDDYGCTEPPALTENVRQYIESDEPEM